MAKDVRFFFHSTYYVYKPNFWCSYEHFFHFAIAHLLSYGLIKDFHSIWLRPSRTFTLFGCDKDSQKRNHLEVEAAVLSSADSTEYILPAYVRHEITRRAAHVRWTSQFKKPYTDVVKCALALAGLDMFSSEQFQSKSVCILL
jgi:hypothetical protein